MLHISTVIHCNSTGPIGESVAQQEKLTNSSVNNESNLHECCVEFMDLQAQQHDPLRDLVIEIELHGPPEKKLLGIPRRYARLSNSRVPSILTTIHLQSSQQRRQSPLVQKQGSQQPVVAAPSQHLRPSIPSPTDPRATSISLTSSHTLLRHHEPAPFAIVPR